MSLNVYNPETKKWEEFRHFPETYNKKNDSWHWANGFVYWGGRWVHAWRTVDTTVAIPTVKGTYTYTKDSTGVVTQYVQFNNFDEEHVEIKGGKTSEKNAGTYTVIVGLKDNHSQWSDGTSDDKTIQWTIAKRTTSIPTVKGTYTYTKSTQSQVVRQTVQFNNLDTLYAAKDSGTDTASDAGTYTVNFKVLDTKNIQWPDGTTKNQPVDWTIQRRSLDKPVQYYSLTYNGSNQSPTWRYYDSDVQKYVSQTSSSETSKKDAGTYYVYFHLLDTANTWWKDTTVLDYKAPWTIGQATESIPSLVSVMPTYNGNTFYFKDLLDYYNNNTMSTGGSDSEKDAGTYRATLSLKDTKNYKWSDNTTASKTYDWSINPIYMNVSSPQFAIPQRYTGTLNGSISCGYSGVTCYTNAGQHEGAAFVKNNKGEYVEFGYITVYGSSGEYTCAFHCSIGVGWSTFSANDYYCTVHTNIPVDKNHVMSGSQVFQDGGYYAIKIPYWIS